MSRLEKAMQIRDAVKYISNGMISECVQMSGAGGHACRGLVDRFYLENKDLFLRRNMKK